MINFYKNFKRAIILLLVCTLSISLFACSGIEFENQKVANAKEFSLGEVMIFMSEEKNKYENRFNSQVWGLKNGDGTAYFKDYIVYTVKKFVEKIMKLKLAANDLNVIVSQKDDELLKTASDEYFNSLTFGDLEFMNCSEEDAYNAYKDYHIARLVIDNLYMHYKS